MEKQFDVMIVGAGLVGLVLATLLVKQDFKVAIIERNAVDVVELNEHCQLRVSAINLACQKLFEQIGIWQQLIDSNRISSFEKMCVWDSLGRGEINFDCTEIAEPCLGHIIENSLIHNSLIEQLLASPNLTLFAEHEPVSVSLNNRGISLTCRHQQQNKILSGELLIGADGASSWVRKIANLSCYAWSYHHHALVTTVATELANQKTAWQCFLENGPLALLPLKQSNQCSIVWSSIPDEIKKLQSLSESQFNAEISNAFEYRLGAIKKISNHIVVPLSMQHAKSYITDRVALIGDAAHTLHPLAGQGINLGFLDAAELARNIIAAKQSQNDCGDYLWLRKYERVRKSDNWMMIAGMEVFKRLFQNNSSVVAGLRSRGLNLVDKFNFIKEQFIYKATGL